MERQNAELLCRGIPGVLNDLEGLHPSADFRQMLGFALPLCFFYVSAANNELRWLC